MWRLTRLRRSSRVLLKAQTVFAEQESPGCLNKCFAVVFLKKSGREQKQGLLVCSLDSKRLYQEAITEAVLRQGNEAFPKPLFRSQAPRGGAAGPRRNRRPRLMPTPIQPHPVGVRIPF